MGEPQTDLAGEVEKRKTWFYECQLRLLNLDSFRGITELTRSASANWPFPDNRIDLVSEPLYSWSFPGRSIGGTLKELGQVYLDDQEPVWTQDENTRRDKFQEGFIGRIDNWLGYKDGRRLAAKLNELRLKYEQSTFSSITDLDPNFTAFARSPPGWDGDSMGRAISRATLAAAKPWLIPELYNAKNEDSRPIENWIDNLEQFLDNFESDLGIALGGSPEKPTGQALNTDTYRAWIKGLLEAAPVRDTAASLRAQMLSLKTNPDNSTSYVYDWQVETAGYPMGLVDQFPFSEKLKYWKTVLKSSLGEVYVSKPNADMGLCHIMRVVYLFGTLPLGLGADGDLTWRQRPVPATAFGSFFGTRARDPKLKDDPALQDRFQKAQLRLQVLLEESAAHPRSPSPMFSPLAQEVVRQAIHSFKFWLDEYPQVKNADNLVRARTETGITTNPKEQASEMEYWSENHYIMFASSEYLAGQLWESDTFQPCKEFLNPDDKSGILSGKQRKERGAARLLKWLNNKLMFGWTEFNSSGYYREHLWSLLNLADFALDKEIRDKAAIVADLLLFDVARFLHKGTMGAAGGRSQFKSKSSGFDNALCDVVEILFGSRGIFGDNDSQIGAAMASSTYRTPGVLLEIGTHPPDAPFTDRSRVSITFEEAPKYGINYSQDTDQKNSVMQGYAPKRARYFPFIERVYQRIAQSHNNYGATEDDTVFWWGCSAFYPHQIVRNTFKTVVAFGLEKSPIFHGALPTLIKLVAGYEKVKHRAILGGIVGGIFGHAGFGAVVGAVEALGEDLAEVFFKDDSLIRTLEEAATDDLSVLLEGSVRTRANLYSYRNPAIMLGTIQNFRAGQLNFQSSVCQVSIHPSLNVFLTAGLEDIDISDLEAALGGGGIGGLLGTAVEVVSGGTAGAVLAGLSFVGAAGGVIANRLALTHQDTLVDHGDGPGWWTGSWSLPMIAQHRSAAILAFDFHSIQTLLAKCGSHVWFPKTAFDRVDEMRTSAYDDANFPLLDIGDIGPKGFWVFGRYVHSAQPGLPKKEAYVGVFSDQRPSWQDQDSDFYKQQIKELVRDKIDSAQDAVDDAVDKIEGEIGGMGADFIKSFVDQAVGDAYRENISPDDWNKAALDALSKNQDVLVQGYLEKVNTLAKAEISLRILQRVWPDPLPQDYFAGRDWYVKGKNVWIVQVGGSDEFGDFQNFKDQVSKARVHLDNAGDLECSYDSPQGDGSSERLTLAYGDGGTFGLNGGTLQTDLYPRFENPFLRGGRVEWGQREFVIEYRGKSLLLDFSDFDNPVRLEQPKPAEDERNVVKAFVIFLQTGDEDMDAFTVATGNVMVGCDQVAREQVLAAGPIGENTYHDAEWIFIDRPVPRQPDMTLQITHPASTDGDETPHWKMSFQLFALMGDRVVRRCTTSGTFFEFEDENRTSPPFSFSIQLLEWRPWQAIPGGKAPIFWQIACQRDFSLGYYDYADLLALDLDRKLWHRRLMTCAAGEKGWFAATSAIAGGTAEPDLNGIFFAAAVSAQPGSLYLAIQSQGTFFANQPGPSGEWSAPWSKIEIWVYPDGIFGLPDTSGAPIPVALSHFSPVAGLPLPPFNAVELTLLAADGHFYSRVTSQPIDIGPWRKIDVSGFSALPGVEFTATGDFLLALSADRSLWATVVDHSANHLFATWEKLSSGDFPVSAFTAIEVQGACRIVASSFTGNVRSAMFVPGAPAIWNAADLPNTTPAPGSSLVAAAPVDGQAKFFGIGADSKVYALDWGGSWKEVAADGKGLDADPVGGLAAVSRVSGQVELYAQGKDASLNKAWWS